MGVRVLALAYLSRQNATARHRLYAYQSYLNKRNVSLDISSPFSDNLFRRSQKYKVLKILLYAVMLWNRVLDLFRVRCYDAVVVQRELFPYGPPILEWLVCRVARRVIYDLDDAIYAPPIQARKAWLGFRRLLLSPGKASKIAAWSQVVVVGNETLAANLRPVARKLHIIPTPVPTDRYQPRQSPRERASVVVGWIGNPVNLSYLSAIAGALRQAQQMVPFVLRVVSSKPYPVPGVETEFRKWSEEQELHDLQSFDIGIMPLPNNEYTRGKCAYKVLQYMSVGIPVICSPVGMNQDVVKHGFNGYHASSPDEWVEAIVTLVRNVGLRQTFGANGRQVAREDFSYHRWTPVLESLLSGANEADGHG